MTPEELDDARAEEAYRQWREEGCQGDDTIDVAAIAARLARENWTPPEPEPVDPDLLAFREWAACRSEENCATAWASAYRQGRFDRKDDARAYLAGARMATERERERAEALDWLTDKTSLELHWRADPEEDGAWCVHMVVGGVNDREWNLLATGETPLAALKSARSTLAKYRGEA